MAIRAEPSDGFHGRTVAHTLERAVDAANRPFEVKNEGNQLLPSMTAQVFFVRAEARNVLVVPMAALQQGQQIVRAQEEKNKGKDKKSADASTAKNGAKEAAARWRCSEGMSPCCAAR